MFLVVPPVVSVALAALHCSGGASRSTVTVGLQTMAQGQGPLPDLWATPSPFLCFSSSSKMIVENSWTQTVLWYQEGPQDTSSQSYESRVAYLAFLPMEVHYC